MKIRSSQGFTLMELLVVLAVMGVMMGLIGFSLLGGGGNELGAAQRELLGLVLVMLLVDKSQYPLMSFGDRQWPNHLLKG